MTSHYESQNARDDDIEREGKQTERADPGGAAFGSLNSLITSAAPLDKQAPEQDAARNKLNDAIDTKTLQRYAASDITGDQRHAGLDDHPANGNKFNPDAKPDLRLSRGLCMWNNLCLLRHSGFPFSFSLRESEMRRGKQVVRNCTFD